MRGKLTIINKERFISRFLAFLLNWNVICGIFDGIFRIVSPIIKINGINTAFFAVLFVLITGFIILKRNVVNFSLLFLLLWIILFITSVIALPSIVPIASRAVIYFTLNVFCIMYLFSQISDVESFVDDLMLYAYICIIYCIVQLFLPDGSDNYSMTFTYSTMISGLLVLTRGTKEKVIKRKVINYVLFGIIFITNLKCGSRGGMLCYAFAIFLLFYFTAQRKQVKMALSFSAVLLFIGMYFSKIVDILTMYFPDSRNIRLLATGQFLYWSGRDKYYSYILDEIKAFPFKFRGLYSDRIYLSNYFGNTGKNEIWGTYVHNIYLEMIFQLGCFILPVLIVFTIYVLLYLRRIKRLGNVPLIVVSVIFISFSICQLMLSSSYLLAPSFGGLIGVLMLGKRERKRLQGMKPFGER